MREVLLAKPSYSCGFELNLFQPVPISLPEQMSEAVSYCSTVQ